MTVRELTRETVLALEGLGGKVGCAIQCHQELLPADPDTVEQVVLGKARTDLHTDGGDMARGDRIEEGAEVMVAGALRDAKQGVGVIAALVCLAPALVLQKRGRLGKEEAQGASGRIWHTVGKSLRLQLTGADRRQRSLFSWGGIGCQAPADRCRMSVKTSWRSHSA